MLLNAPPPSFILPCPLLRLVDEPSHFSAKQLARPLRCARTRSPTAGGGKSRIEFNGPPRGPAVAILYSFLQRAAIHIVHTHTRLRPVAKKYASNCNIKKLQRCSLRALARRCKEYQVEYYVSHYSKGPNCTLSFF